MAVLLVLAGASGSAAPQSCGIFVATRPRWAPKGLTLGACSIFRGPGAAGASAALQLAAASQAAGCSCGAPAQKRRKKRRIRAPLCGGCMWSCPAFLRQLPNNIYTPAGAGLPPYQLLFGAHKRPLKRVKICPNVAKKGIFFLSVGVAPPNDASSGKHSSSKQLPTNYLII